ncbi:MAG: sulfatase [bacterium]|nr:sulfatase [bacterium]
MSLALIWLLATSGCRRSAPASSGSKDGDARARLPNIIVLTVDTLRADHLALYDYARDTMPAIETLARTATTFDNAVVPRGSTRPSYASMLTGLYPFRHGVRSNGAVLHEDLTTLPEILAKRGYHTAAFVSNFVLLGELSGCGQGFDIYDDRVDERETNRTNYERTAANTATAILEWIETGPAEPFLLFTNFIDPHGPYRPPPRFRKMFRSTQTRKLKTGQIPPYQLVDGVTDYHDYVDRYDAEIRYVDDALATVIEALRARGLWDDALVIFTADHGESLGEHGIFFEHHLHVYEETERVPLIIRLPINDGAAAIPARVPDLCSPMDLLPTVLSHLGISVDRPLDGRDLLPAIRGQAAADRFLFVEFLSAATPNGKLPDIYAIRTASRKMLRLLDPATGQIAQEAFYDVARDPLEASPARYDAASADHRGLRQQMDRMLETVRGYKLPFTLTVYEMPPSQRPDFVKNRPPPTGQVTKTLTAEQIERLRSLGYVE